MSWKGSSLCSDSVLKTLNLGNVYYNLYFLFYLQLLSWFSFMGNRIFHFSLLFLISLFVIFWEGGTISHRSHFIGTILAVNILKQKKQKKQKNKNYFKMFTLPGEHDVDVKYQVPHPSLPLSSLLSSLFSLLWFSVICKIKKLFL